jgi:hypothetical protein
MDADERARLEAKGYMVVDDAADWLGLDEVERRVVDLRVRLGREVRRRREQARLSQAELARRIQSSGSRIADAEGATEGVAIDLLMRAFFASGGTLADLAAI